MPGRLLVAIVALLISHASARADDWSTGVSEDRKAHAHELLEAGNALFVDNNYADALAKYREAIAVWDHPAIRFNIVRCLVQLERPIEAWDNLEAALRYGAGALEPAVYEEALAFKRLLAHQIGHIEIRCTQPGAKIVLDGDTLGTCPAVETRRVLPGTHVVVGSLAGYLTRSQDVVVVGGGDAHADISLIRLSDAAHVTHRWPIWIPWVVAGAGAAVAGIGGLVELKARSDQDLYERTVTKQCSSMACDDPALVGLHDSAVSENRFAIGMMSLGIAAVATGGVLLYMNRAQVDYDVSATGAIVRLRVAM